MRAMTPSHVDFEPGPPIRPVRHLLEWVRNEPAVASGRRLLRVPVVVRFDEHRLAIYEAFVGLPGDATDGDTIFLDLDDSTMGMSLMSLLADRCAVWLEGHWGRLIDLPVPGPPEERKGWPFTVRRVVDAPVGDDPVPRVRVESPPSGR